MIDDDRILALVRGEPVGDECDCDCHDLGPMGQNPATCRPCNGTGRINTEPMGEVERAVAKLRADSIAEVIMCLRERDEARQALEAERAKVARLEAWGQSFDLPNQPNEIVSRDLMNDAVVRYAWECGRRWAQADHEATKRQLARVRERICEMLCSVGYDGMRHHRLCEEEVRRGKA